MRKIICETSYDSDSDSDDGFRITIIHNKIMDNYEYLEAKKIINKMVIPEINNIILSYLYINEKCDYCQSNYNYYDEDDNDMHNICYTR